MGLHTVKIGLFTAAALLLVGCFSPYQEPRSGPRAEVRFVLLNRLQLGTSTLRTYSAKNCGHEYTIAKLKLRGPAEGNHKSLGMPANRLGRTKSTAFTEVYVPADSPFYVKASYYYKSGYPTTVTTCDTGVLFRPRGGNLYEVVHVITQRKCGLVVYHLIRDENGRYTKQREPSARYRKDPCA